VWFLARTDATALLTCSAVTLSIFSIYEVWTTLPKVKRFLVDSSNLSPYLSRAKSTSDLRRALALCNSSGAILAVRFFNS